jgi:uncharacterized protein (UPF0276 family)
LQETLTMAVEAPRLAVQHTGFGLGLRTEHYSDFLQAKQPVDWLEVITDNYLVDGGKPLQVLTQIRRDYPVALHGVAMSIGAAGGLDLGYIGRVKALAERIEPLWVSDHLCWIGPGPEQLHDLYPLPYTDEAARHVIAQIRQAQDLLQRRLVLENVSSYIDFQGASASEWQFLSHIANEADCLLLVDVNNIHVSSVNHGFDPLTYLNALPAHRVQQIHLAGHSDNGDHIIDTHDHPVAEAVWALYAEACKRFGSVAAMVERDANIPPLAELLTELDRARQVAGAAGPAASVPPPQRESAPPNPNLKPSASARTPSDLNRVQTVLSQYLLNPLPTAGEPEAVALLAPSTGLTPAKRLRIYHHAYRARLNDVLADSFAKTCAFMGSELFEEQACAFAVAHPPLTRSLNRYGEAFPAYLGARYPGNTELVELAQLDWALRTRFDGPDAPALSPHDAQADASATWLQREFPMHPSLCLLPIQTNVVQVWNAIDADQDVPPTMPLLAPSYLVVWRKAWQPHFRSVDAAQAAFLLRLQCGDSISLACTHLAGTSSLADPAQLSVWLQAWLEEAWLVA